MPQNDQIMQKYNTVVTIAQLTPEERLRQQRERREKYERDRINAMNYSYKQGYKDGLQLAAFSIGHDAGFSEGQDSAVQKLFRLNQKLIENNRSSEISKALSDMEYLKKLLAEFGIE